jgi:hypothetical protein
MEELDGASQGRASLLGQRVVIRSDFSDESCRQNDCEDWGRNSSEPRETVDSGTAGARQTYRPPWAPACRPECIGGAGVDKLDCFPGCLAKRSNHIMFSFNKLSAGFGSLERSLR